MSNPLAEKIPSRFLPIAALVAGRPDAAAEHLAAADAARADTDALVREVVELRAEVAQLREELAAALDLVDRALTTANQ